MASTRFAPLAVALSFSLLLLVSAFLPRAAAGTANPAAPAGNVGVTALADTWVDEGNPDQPRGTSAWLKVSPGGDGVINLPFASTLLSFTISALPPEATIDNATLQVHVDLHESVRQANRGGRGH
jgi:hypothetical protein